MFNVQCCTTVSHTPPHTHTSRFMEPCFPGKGSKKRAADEVSLCVMLCILGLACIYNHHFMFTVWCGSLVLLGRQTVCSLLPLLFVRSMRKNVREFPVVFYFILIRNRINEWNFSKSETNWLNSKTRKQNKKLKDASTK